MYHRGDPVILLIYLISFGLIRNFGAGTGLLVGFFLLFAYMQTWSLAFWIVMIAAVYWGVRLIETQWFKEEPDQRVFWSAACLALALFVNYFLYDDINSELYSFGKNRMFHKMFRAENQSSVFWVTTAFLVLGYVCGLYYRRSKVDEWLGEADPEPIGRRRFW